MKSQKLLIILVLLFIVSGCITSLNPEDLAKTNQMVNGFLEKYPDAEIQITHFTMEQSTKIIDQMRDTCNNPYLEPKEIYRVMVEDQKSRLSVIAYVNPNEGIVECAVKKVNLEMLLEPIEHSKEVEKKESNQIEVKKTIISEVDKINPSSKPVTSLYIFSSQNNLEFEGEGFFLDLLDGNELFVYSNFDDYPHDIANTARKLLAISKGIGSFTYSNEKSEEVYLSSKFDLNAEHRILSKDQYKELAAQTKSRGIAKKINMVYYKDLKFSEGELKFYGKDIINVSEITMTTGGSVYLMTVEMREGEPLNIVSGTIEENGEKNLLDLGGEIKQIIGTDNAIIADTISYQDPIYTMNGVRHGWSVFHFNVRVEKDGENQFEKKDSKDDLVVAN